MQPTNPKFTNKNTTGGYSWTQESHLQAPFLGTSHLCPPIITSKRYCELPLPEATGIVLATCSSEKGIRGPWSVTDTRHGAVNTDNLLVLVLCLPVCFICLFTLSFSLARTACFVDMGYLLPMADHHCKANLEQCQGSVS